MPMKEIIHPGKRISTGAYSAAVSIDGWLFVSGQGPLDLSTGHVVAGSVEEQTRLTLTHIRTILEGAGSSLKDVAKCTCYLADIDEFEEFDRVYGEFFPKVRPARTTVQTVLWGGIRVEIDAIARLGAHKLP